ncbi:MAG: biopolymer transporter ExbD [Candidatus Latescibacteria bacterium]|nr:biopolymer transporter ExbD [Candidatus Latescibacterota bacterium]
MAMAVGGSKGGVTSDINVTPLVDVVLVLLIIFMVLLPAIRQGIQVDLPDAQNTKETSEDPSKQVVIAIKDDKSIYVNLKLITKESLKPELEAVYRGKEGQPIVLKSDKALLYGEVYEIMTACRAVGAPGVQLVTQRQKKG